MSASRTVSEIFSVKNSVTLKPGIGVIIIIIIKEKFNVAFSK